MATRIKLRRGTAAQWTSANPTLEAGEAGVETDTKKIKIGDGSTAWTSLSYAVDFSSYATQTYVDNAISSLIDSAPGTLDTLNELAAALNDDPTFFTTVATNLSNHESDTTNIHGIANTADLVYTNDARLSDSRTPTSHTHPTSDITNFTEDVQDVVGGMVSSNTESGIAVTYDDATGKLNFDVNDPTITLSGDVTGTATMTNLGNVSITTTIAADSVALGTDTTGNYVASVSGTDGVSVSGTGESATVTVANTDKGSSQNIFKNVAVSGQSTIVADTNDDTLTVAAGTGITVTTNATTDTLTVTNVGVTSVNGSTGAITNIASTTGKLSQFAATTSAELLGVISDETGTGALVFANSPTLSGTPAAPTANAGTNTTQIATTAFVQTAVSNLVDAAPTTLNTLNELAAALGDDPNFATTVTNSIAGKQPLDADLTAIAGLTGTSGFLKKTAADTWSLDTNTYLTGNQTITLTGDVSGSGTTSISVTVADDSHNHIISNVDGLQTALDARAPLSSPTLTGTPAAPTAAVDTNTTQIATTAYVIGQGYLKSSSYTAADVLTKIKTVDGATSGLDADLLDGQHGSYYLDWTNVTNKPDPTITLGGDASGSLTLTDLAGGTLTVTIADDSHNHIISNIDGLQTALDAKAPLASPTFTGAVTLPSTTEVLNSGTVVSNVFTADFSTGGVFYITTAPTANFTVNVTNLPTTDNRVTVVSVFVIQGATGYIPNALQIGGSAQTIKWSGGTAPTATNEAGKVDNFTFTFVRRGAAWEALGTSNRNF